jgi:hypothetical protein
VAALADRTAVGASATGVGAGLNGSAQAASVNVIISIVKRRSMYPRTQFTKLLHCEHFDTYLVYPKSIPTVYYGIDLCMAVSCLALVPGTDREEEDRLVDPRRDQNDTKHKRLNPAMDLDMIAFDPCGAAMEVANHGALLAMLRLFILSYVAMTLR